MLLKQLFTWFTVIILFQTTNGLNVFKLSQYNEINIIQNWKHIQTSLLEAEQLLIQNSGLSQKTLSQILKYPMKNIKIITFSSFHPTSTIAYQLMLPIKQFLTPKLTEIIFKSSYFSQLKAINFIGANIDNLAFEFMEKWQCEKSNLQKILLGNNFIGTQGFNRIAKLPLNSLKQLDISSNLLIADESIDAIIKLICGKDMNQEGRCYNKLKILDISSTNMNRHSFIHLFKTIDVSELEHLNISNLNLHFGIKYNDPFNLSAFEFLSSLHFPRLKSLYMNDMSLDAKVLQHFSNWTFPSLISLSLSHNFIDSHSVKYWLTKLNFPKLSKLILYMNQIDDEGFQFLFEQKFNLTQLNFGKTKITVKSLVKLAEVDIYRLQKLSLAQLKINSTHLKYFVNQANLTALKQFILLQNMLISDLFDYLSWQKLKNLQTLLLSNCDLHKIYQSLLNYNKTISNSLIFLMINGTSSTQQYIQSFLHKVSNLFPSLKYLNVMQFYSKPINFSRIEIDMLNQNLVVQMGYAQFYRSGRSFSFIKLMNLGWVVLFSSKIILHSYFQGPQQINIKLNRPGNQYLTLSTNMTHTIAAQLSYLNLSKLKIVTINNQNQFTILKSIISYHSIVELNELDSLIFISVISTTELITFFKSIRLPRLRNLNIRIGMNDFSQNSNQLLEQMIKFAGLFDLKIHFDYGQKITKSGDIHKFLSSLKFPFLMRLDLSNNYLSSVELAGIIHNHSKSIRYLILRDNFIQKSIVTIIRENIMILASLDMSSISFKIEELRELSQIELGFMKELMMDKCDLTPAHLIALVQQNNKHRNYLFPKLYALSLNQNDIREEGLVALFESGLSQLSIIQVGKNSIPNYLNIILTYSCKLIQLISVDVEVYSMDPNLNPISARRIVIMAIQDSIFTERDFQILASLDFNRLTRMQLDISNNYDCNIFHHLLKLIRNVNILFIAFFNQQNGLNSSCLSANPLYLNYTTQIRELMIFNNYQTTFLFQFVQLILTTNQFIKKIILWKMKLPSKLLAALTPNQLQLIEIMYLAKSYFQDDAMIQILNYPLSQIAYLDISYNPITLASVKALTNKQLNRLNYLDISGIQLKDQGLELVSKIKAKNLQKIKLRLCEIYNLSTIFQQFNFPSLQQLDISYNHYSVEHLSESILSINRINLPKLKYIIVLGRSLNLKQYQQLGKLQQIVNVSITGQSPNYLVLANSAGY